MLKVILIALVFASAFATFGVDFSVYQGALSASTFSCFVNNGVRFTSIQLWEQPGVINPYFKENHAAAIAAGIPYNDAYAFVCDNFSAEEICSGVANNLPSGFNGQVWLDIEPSGSCWSGAVGSRLAFVASVATTCEQHGLNMGVYSSYGSWEGVMGSAGASSSVLTRLPIWYAHYDGADNFNDFNALAFGGWTHPAVKQYAGTTSFCGTGVDLNYYP
jgi:GH25 family lysozyme M1 (1,4-beta-N-acetylmuramidase)